MRTKILEHLNDAGHLEKMYRENKRLFKKEFNAIYSDISEQAVAKVWHERLSYESADISWGSSSDLIFVIFASLLAGFVAKLPQTFHIQEDFFYSRNSSFIVFPFLAAYFLRKNKSSLSSIFALLSVFLICLFYINWLPDLSESHSLILSFVHLPLFLWAILGFSFVGKERLHAQKRLDFLRYNGDLVVMSTLILIAGMILTGLTIGLFSLIGIDIAHFYSQYVVVFGLAAIPLVGTYLTQTNPQLVTKVSPVIAKLFSPIVLVTLVIYLFAIIISGKDPYNDRDFLLVFNGLLIGVMALILFSVAETSRTETQRSSLVILFLLSLVTVIVNGIALSAIVFRIAEWGITPNRMAVLGGNVLILINLVIVCFRLFKTLRSADHIEQVDKAIADFLPIYGAWTMLVTFTFPFIFGYR
jgi:hypothetical protein